MTAAEIYSDLFHLGYSDLLLNIVERSEVREDYRELCRELGKSLKEDADWRDYIKGRVRWNRRKSDDWTGLVRDLERRRSDRPWWDILTYADGQPVSTAVVEFFEGDAYQIPIINPPPGCEGMVDPWGTWEGLKLRSVEAYSKSDKYLSDLSEGKDYGSLRNLLQDADTDFDCREVARTIGRQWRTNDALREKLKIERSHFGPRTQWGWMEYSTEKWGSRTGPWRELLRYADRLEVSDDARSFFEGDAFKLPDPAETGLTAAEINYYRAKKRFRHTEVGKDLKRIDGGEFHLLRIVLKLAAQDDSYRKSVVALGRALRDIPDFQHAVRTGIIWGHGQTWWEWLELEIARQKSQEPWWDILTYIDGINVPQAVVDFFRM